MLLEYAAEDDIIVVWRVDRLGRSLIDVLNTVILLFDRGIHVRSISDGIDPVTSTGRLMLNMLATLAECERELIIERVNAGIAREGTHRRRRRAARGLEPCSALPPPASPRCTPGFLLLRETEAGP